MDTLDIEEARIGGAPIGSGGGGSGGGGGGGGGGLLRGMRRFFGRLCGGSGGGGGGLFSRSGSSALSLGVDADMDMARAGVCQGQVMVHEHVIDELQRRLALWVVAYDALAPNDLRRGSMETQMVTLDQQIEAAKVRLTHWRNSWQSVEQWNTSAGHSNAMRNALQFNEDFVRRVEEGMDASQLGDIERTQQIQMQMEQMQQQLAASKIMETQIVRDGAEAAAALMASSATSATVVAGVGAGAGGMRAMQSGATAALAAGGGGGGGGGAANRTIADILAAGRRLAADSGAIVPAAAGAAGAAATTAAPMRAAMLA